MKTLGHNTDAYYKFHARIYDLTRWAFLFGRASMVKEIAKLKPRSVLEVGCGTGRNLIELKELDPSIHCYGLDSSKDMLEVAKVKSGDLKIEWIQGRYPSFEVNQIFENEMKPDVILFSYSLSMFNPGYDTCLEEAHKKLSPDGVVCVVDFHNSPFSWFRKWMGMNHVRMESQLLESVKEIGELTLYREGKGLGGVWRYNTMMSRPKAS